MRCSSCGATYDDGQSDFCPHHRAAVIGPSIAATPPAQSALEAVKLELSNRLLAAGLPPSSFRTWIDLSDVQAPHGGVHDEIPAQPALFVAVTPDHPRAADAAEEIGRLPNKLGAFEIHFMEGQ